MGMLLFQDYDTGEEILTPWEHDVLMAKLSSGITMSRAVSHACSMLADDLDSDMPWEQRYFLYTREHAMETVHSSEAFAMASAISEGISASVERADAHRNTADEIWKIITDLG